MRPQNPSAKSLTKCAATVLTSHPAHRVSVANWSGLRPSIKLAIDRRSSATATNTRSRSARLSRTRAEYRDQPIERHPKAQPDGTRQAYRRLPIADSLRPAVELGSGGRLGYSLPVLKSALPLRTAESRVQFSGWTLSHRLPLPRSLPSLSSRLNHCSAVLILLGWISSSRA